MGGRTGNEGSPAGVVGSYFDPDPYADSDWYADLIYQTEWGTYGYRGCHASALPAAMSEIKTLSVTSVDIARHDVSQGVQKGRPMVRWTTNCDTTLMRWTRCGGPKGFSSPEADLLHYEQGMVRHGEFKAPIPQECRSWLDCSVSRREGTSLGIASVRSRWVLLQGIPSL